MELDRDVPALIAKIGSYPEHHGVLGAVRSLGSAGVRVFAITEGPHVPVAYSRWLTGMFVWRNGDLHPDALRDGLIDVARRIGGRPVVIPTDDRMAIFLAEHQERFRPLMRLPEQAPHVPRLVASKAGLARTCVELGIPTPRVTVPEDWSAALDFCSEVGFPVVGKVAEPDQLANAPIRSTRVLSNRDELAQLWRRMAPNEGERTALLLQEYIPVGEDWIVHAYRGQDARVQVANSATKLRSFPAFAGVTTLARVQRNPEVLELAHLVLDRLDYRGIADMDWRLDRRDGRYKLLDLNPRLGAQFRLFVDGYGLDIVQAQHLDLSGRSVPMSSALEGRTMVVEPLDLRAGLGAYRRAGLTPVHWYRSVRAADEAAWLDTHDALPPAVLATRLALRIGLRAARAVGATPRRARPLRVTERDSSFGRPLFRPGRRDRVEKNGGLST